MSARTRLIIVGVAALLVSLLFYFFFIKSRQAELSDVRAEVSAAEAETSALQADVQRLEGLEENAPQLEAELQRFRQFVPEQHEVPNFIFQVQEAADESGVDFVQITPELPRPPAEAAGATIAQVRVTIGAGGGYFAVQDFMRRLYELDRALRIDTMQLGAGPEGGAETGQATDALTVSMTARIFFELPAGATPVAPGTAPATPAPAASPAATTAPSPDGSAEATPGASPGAGEN